VGRILEELVMVRSFKAGLLLAGLSSGAHLGADRQHLVDGARDELVHDLCFSNVYSLLAERVLELYLTQLCSPEGSALPFSLDEVIL